MLLYHTIITINRFVSKDLIAFIPEDLKHEHGTNPVSHSHDGEDNHDNCVLGEPVVVFSNESKPDFKVVNDSDRPDHDGIHDNLLNKSRELLIQVLSSCVYERVTDSLFPSAVPDSHGLRAPPAV